MKKNKVSFLFISFIFWITLSVYLNFKTKKNILSENLNQPINSSFQIQKPKLNLTQTNKLNLATNTPNETKTRAPQSVIKKVPNYFKIDHENLIVSNVFNNHNFFIYPLAEVRNETNTKVDLLTEIAHLRIFKKTNPNQNPLQHFSKDNLAISYNSRLSELGVITGIIIIKTEDSTSLFSLLQKLNLTVVHSFENIQTYFITSQMNVFNLEKIFLEIKSQTFVANAELEILTKTYEKN